MLSFALSLQLLASGSLPPATTTSIRKTSAATSVQQILIPDTSHDSVVLKGTDLAWTDPGGEGGCEREVKSTSFCRLWDVNSPSHLSAPPDSTGPSSQRSAVPNVACSC